MKDMVRISILVAFVIAQVAYAAPGRAPRRADVARMLRQALKTEAIQTEVLADAGGGRFPVLFVTRGTPGKEDQHVDEQGDGPRCRNTNVPHVAIAAVGPTGLLLETQLELPTSNTACDWMGPLEWGVTRLHDHDLDGQPELVVVYGYNGANHSEIGNERYKELAIVELRPVKIALHVVLSDIGCASIAQQMKSEWRFLPRAGAPDDFQLTRTIASLGRGCDLDDWSRVEVTTEVTLYRHGGDHAWLPIKTEKKIRPAQQP
jgi:hypothetical protein